MKKYFLVLVLVLGLVSVADANEIVNCFNYLESQNYQLAKQSGQSAVALYPTSAEAHGCLGAVYNKLGYFNLSIQELKLAENLTNNKRFLGVIYSYLGTNYNSLGDLITALAYYNRSLQIDIELNKTEGISRNLNNIALVYTKQGNYDKALEYYNKSLQFTSNPSSIATTYNNIATVYSGKGDNNKAVEYYKKAVEFAQKAGDYHETAMYMINLGHGYTDLKNFSEAKYYLQEGLSMIQNLGDKYWEAYGYVSFGKLYLAQNKKSLAKEYFKKAYNLFKATGDNSDAQGVYEKYLK